MPALYDDDVPLPDGPRLALRRADPVDAGDRRPFLLVHGLASNARLWDGVAHRLGAAGHPAVAVDLRGHGRSEAPQGGYDTDTCAADLAALCGVLGFTGDRAPVVAGQSWGANVVLTMAARHGGVAALALVDGGWSRLRDRFPTFDACWEQLAPPRFDGMAMADLRARIAGHHRDWPADGIEGTMANFAELPDGTVRARLDRAHHRDILHSLWTAEPGELYPHVAVPVLLAAPEPAAGDAKRRAVEAARAALRRARVSWYAGADHDLHAQHPDRLAAELLDLAGRAQ